MNVCSTQHDEKPQIGQNRLRFIRWFWGDENLHWLLYGIALVVEEAIQMLMAAHIQDWKIVRFLKFLPAKNPGLECLGVQP